MAGIHVRQTETGVEYHFAAARNPSFALGLTAFLLIWTGALWLQIALDAPWFFPLLTGLFELLLLAQVSMQTSGRSGTPYYEIRATTRAGRRHALGNGISKKAHAEWLANDMRSAIGLHS